MKKVFLILTGAMICCSSIAGDAAPKGAGQAVAPKLKGTLTVTCTPEVVNLAQNWADGFIQSNPGVQLNVIKLKPGEKVLGTAYNEDLAIVIPGQAGYGETQNLWKMSVGRDIIVALVNSSNPFLQEINTVGISPSRLAALLASGKQVTWGDLTGKNQENPVNFYMAGNPPVRTALAGFLGMEPDALTGIDVVSSQGLENILGKDPYAIGFCNLTEIIGTNQSALPSILGFLPFDKNNSGRMENYEQIYGDLSDFMRGVWIGKYPKSLILNTYAMARQTPAENLTIGFLRYVVNEGQGAVSASGLFSLIPSERNSKTDMLPYNIPLSSATGINLLQLAITIAAGLVVILLIASLINRYRRNHGAGLSERLSHIKGAFSENCLVVPKGLFYDKTHTWAYMEADGTVKVGIDDFLQHVTGKLTRIRTKGIGDRIKKGEPMLTFIQNGKQLVIKSPVSGTIKSENLVLITDPSLINSSPYSDGWFYEIEPSNWLRETQILLMADKYSEWIKGEFHRLRDFLAGIFKPEAPEYSYVILQDGGEIADNVLSSLGPEAWEEFQIQFIDSANQ